MCVSEYRVGLAEVFGGRAYIGGEYDCFGGVVRGVVGAWVCGVGAACHDGEGAVGLPALPPSLPPSLFLCVCGGESVVGGTEGGREEEEEEGVIGIV